MDSSDIFCLQERYFQDALHLFDEYQWLIKYPVTEMLIQNVLQLIPIDWLITLRKLNHIELNEFAIGRLIRHDWPSSLLFFLHQCKKLNKLSQTSQAPIIPASLSSNLCRGLNLKKQHEVAHLVNFIHEKCNSEGIRTIVDFGSGLGYICQALNDLYGYRVFGLESNYKIYMNACMRQKLFPQSYNKVKYLWKMVSFEDIDDIKFIENMIGSSEKICLMGLHACGDLGVNSVSAFPYIKQSKLLIMISCCYHKLNLSENNEILRFGVSNTFRQAVLHYNNEKRSECDKKHDVRRIFNRPFMRLACQEPAIRWEGMSDYDHKQHAHCVLSRAILELFVHEKKITLKKCVRKSTKKSQCSNFDSYLADVMQRYTFNGKNESQNNELINEIRTIWSEHQEKLCDVEIFTALQMLIQAPAESLVLEDRRFLLTEISLQNNMNIENEIIQIFNPKISPRCNAIVARI